MQNYSRAIGKSGRFALERRSKASLPTAVTCAEALPASPLNPPEITRLKTLPALLVLVAVLFNAGLAVVNGHVADLSANAVIAAELLIVVAAYATILCNFRPEMLPWTLMMGVAIVFALIRAVVVGHFDPKFLRDVLLIPTFVMLGMTTSWPRLTWPLALLHAIVVGGVLFEAFFPQVYSNLFEVRAYYIATRSFDDSAFWNSSSDLFVSATRPDERFFSFIDLHRVSSIFLEPVSLGNYVVIITAFLCANYRHLSTSLCTFFALGNLVALIGCDGRLATVASVLIALVTLVAPRFPRGAAVLYLPTGLIGAYILSSITKADPEQDNFLGRVALCIDLLTRYDVQEWLGVSSVYLFRAADSGIAYMIATQSFIVLLLFWFVLVGGANERRPEQVKFLHAVCLYVVLTMIVSYSLFSIKTAVLVWVLFGALQVTPMGSTSVREAQYRCSRSGNSWRLGTQQRR